MTTALRAPLLWLLLPFGAGLLWEHAGAAPGAAGLALLASSGALAAALAGRSGNRLAWSVWAAGLAVAAAAFGAGWLRWRSPAPREWTAPPREVTVTLRAEQVFPPAPQRKTVNGIARILRADPAAAAPLVGQRVYFSAIRRIGVPPVASGEYRFTGVVEALPPPDGNDRNFAAYLASLGVRVRIVRGHLSEELRAPTGFQRFCESAQDRLGASLRRGLERHPEIVSLYLAMLLGEKAVLSAEQQNAFMRSGVFHIFSISGLHVGVIAMAILSALQLLRVPRRTAVIAGLAVLWLYVEITGGSAPAVRSFLMIAFWLGSRVFRLPSNPLAALAAAALATLLLDPRQLFATGFQMSYSVVAALLVMGLPLAERWQARWQPWRDLPEVSWRPWQRWVRDRGRELLGGLAITWAATLASAPSSIGYFGLFSPGALVANLVIIPLSSLAIVAGFLAMLGGLAHLGPLVLVFNHAAALLIRAMDGLVQRGTDLPGVYFPAEFRAGWMAPAALVLVLATMFAGASLRWRPRAGGYWPPVVAVALVVIFGVKFG
ncbi:ComEC/Rec2 family competence protein [Oleiharenicola sp. Vm1]|uniref:ComEC/Rec2 family competence protein n=1 Tax=Oleiharenicola sp. Vm1 TaxID=3398393 RepID=UPI0039F4C29E